VCDAARAYALPVLYDVVGRVAQAELLAEQYGCRLHLPHLGSFADDWRAQLGLIDHLERHASIYSDTAGFGGSTCWPQPSNAPASHKMLFGSDGPWLPQWSWRGPRARVPVGRKALILGGNFQRPTARVRRPVRWPSDRRLMRRRPHRALI
jgi:hypothetical protein